MITVEEIQRRLRIIFPEGTDHRNYLTREMAAKTVFVALYAGAIQGADRWIRPNQVCRMTEEQSVILDEASRDAWYQASGKNKFRPDGKVWFADNSREPIRDETIGEGFLPVGAMTERPGLATTSSLGRYALEAEFSALFDSDLDEDAFEKLAEKWREKHLSRAALARQALIAQGAIVSANDVQVTFPNGETRVLSSGPSSVISKAVIELFAPRFLKSPHVLWLSESKNKVVARDEKLANSLGLRIDMSKTLPDIILVDLGIDADEMLMVFVEVVATDGPINRQRKSDLAVIATEAGFEEKSLAFVTAFMDRGSAIFRKAIVEIAWGTYVWLVSEPDNVIDMHDGSVIKLSERRRGG